MVSHTFKSPAETQAWAEKFARTLTRGDVLALIGPLGAGKTTFVQGLAKGLGLKNKVTSPTFALVNEYLSKTKNLYHMDVYRLSERELRAFPLEEYYETGICIIEWGDRLRERWPVETLALHLKPGQGSRRLTIKEITPRWRKRLADLA